MHPELDDWDAAYVTEAATLDESVNLEKKQREKFDLTGSKGALKEVLAKAISAFSNTDGGFLIFGLPDDGGFDAGLLNLVGHEPATHWIEKTASNLVSPKVFKCRARFITCPAQHAADHGVLIIQIPKSDARPHWVTTTDKQDAYLRIGARSEPMPKQTFVDILTRGSQPSIEIMDLIVSKDTAEQWSLSPVVALNVGPVCHNWVVDVLCTPDGAKLIMSMNSNHTKISESHLALEGIEPLYQGRPTKATSHPVRFSADKGKALTDYKFKVRVYAESMPPVERDFSLK